MLVMHRRNQRNDPVPPENSITGLNCDLDLAADAVMVGWPDAAQDRLSADALVIRPSCPGVSRGPGEERRVAGAPTRERGAAPERRPGAVRASRPGLVRRAYPVHPAAALGRGLPRDACNAAGLAPQTRRQEVRHQAPPARPAGDCP